MAQIHKKRLMDLVSNQLEYIRFMITRLYHLLLEPLRQMMYLLFLRQGPAYIGIKTELKYILIAW